MTPRPDLIGPSKQSSCSEGLVEVTDWSGCHRCDEPSDARAAPQRRTGQDAVAPQALWRGSSSAEAAAPNREASAFHTSVLCMATFPRRSFAGNRRGPKATPLSASLARQTGLRGARQTAPTGLVRPPERRSGPRTNRRVGRLSVVMQGRLCGGKELGATAKRGQIESEAAVHPRRLSLCTRESRKGLR